MAHEIISTIKKHFLVPLATLPPDSPWHFPPHHQEKTLLDYFPFSRIVCNLWLSHTNTHTHMHAGMHACTHAHTSWHELFLVWLLSIRIIIFRFTHASVVHYNLLQTSVPFCRCTAVYLCLHLPTDFCDVSNFWLLHIKLPWTSM